MLSRKFSSKEIRESEVRLLYGSSVVQVTATAPESSWKTCSPAYLLTINAFKNNY
jgi:hypothetical protein